MRLFDDQTSQSAQVSVCLVSEFHERSRRYGDGMKTFFLSCGGLDQVVIFSSFWQYLVL